jgi:hypothetical protein
MGQRAHGAGFVTWVGYPENEVFVRLAAVLCVFVVESGPENCILLGRI